MTARADSVVTFNEIHYHPAGQSDSEWIELTNLMAVNVDLSGWSIRGGVDFHFPEGTVIEAGAYLVVAANPAGLPGALGPWTGNLSNAGEQLRLRNNSGRMMNAIDFRDGGEWPAAADGAGATLAKIVPNSASDIASNWVASREVNGTPGAANFPTGLPSTGVVINEIAPAADDVFRIELKNLGDSPAALTSHAIASPGGIFALPPRELAAGEFLVIDALQLGFTPGQGDLLVLTAGSGAEILDARRVTGRLRGRSQAHPHRWLFPQAASFGTENPFALQEDVVINEIMYHFREDPGSAPAPPVIEEHPLVPIDAVWRYNETGEDLGPGWAGTSHPVDNAAWRQGAALLGAETNPAELPEPLRTPFANPLTNRIITYYLETDFEWSAARLAETTGLVLRHVIDDGAVFYLNGSEVARVHLPEGEPITSTTTATVSVGTAAYSDWLALPPELLKAGTNRLSVEVHQRSATSGDVVFGAELAAAVTVSPGHPGSAIVERDEQWVELHNRGKAAIGLAGWSLEGGIAFTFAEDAVLEAGGYCIIAGDAAAMRARYPAHAGQILGSFSGRLNRARDTVRLEDASGNPADEVTYLDGGRWPALADGDGSSLELRDPRADNASAEAWAASGEASKGVWQTVRYRMEGSQNYGLSNWREFRVGMLRAGEVLLDDLSVVRDPDGAAEELIQNGDFESDPGDAKWRFLGNHRHTFIAADPDNAGNRVLHLIATGATDTRHNHLETTFRDNTALQNSATYEVSFRARWLAGSNQLNTRAFQQRLARTTALQRPEFCGTPGISNSQAVPNIGPTYSGLQHRPAIPQENETVTVSACLDDPDGLGEVTLRARIDGDGTTSSHAFEMDAGGCGTGELPGLAAGTVVQFWLAAKDALGAVSFIPAGGQQARALYQVADGRSSNVPAHELRVVMLEADSNFMHDRFNVMSNESLGGTAIYNGTEVFYNVGVRLRGSGAGRARDGNDYRGFRVSFPADHLFRGVHDSVGMDRSGRTPGARRQDEIYVKHMFNRAGIPCMFDDLVYFIPPTRVHTGTSIMMMAGYGPVFTESQFENGENGSVFNYDITYDPSSSVGGREGLKPPSPFQHIGTDIRDLGDDKEQYRVPYELRTGRRRDDYSGWIRFCKVLDLPAGELDQQIDEWMDVDEWMRYSALMGLCGIGDTYILGGLQHNIRFYVPEDGRGVVALPWDMDFTFSASTSASMRSPGAGNIRKVFNIPRNQRLYWGHVQDLISTTFHEDYMAPWLAHYGSVVRQSYTSQTSYIRARRAAVTRQLPAKVPFEVTTHGGADFTIDASIATLEGKGWIDIREFRLAGSDEILPAQWTDDETWRVPVPLRPGENALELQTFDFQGQPLDSHALTITSLVTGPAAVDFLRITEIHYHPSGSGDAEFIELRNIGTQTLDISGVRFTSGIGFTFAEGTLLGAGDHVIVALDLAAFEEVHGPGLPVAGVFASGRLDNSGEALELRDRAGIVIHAFRYDDSWVAATDGGGASLTVVDEGAAVASWGNAAQWRASSSPEGTPGRADAAGEPLDYGSWLTRHFTPEEIADPAVTGPDIVLHRDTPNLLKFAFGLDPRRPDPAGSLPSAGRIQDQLLFTYRRNRTAAVRLDVEQSTNLDTWIEASTSAVAVTPIDAENDLITVRINAASPSAFLRIAASLAP